MLKLDFGPSEYVNNIFINKRQCSAFAKFRYRVAPITLETGQYENLPEEQHLCPKCDSEIHVLTKCNLHIDRFIS